MTLQKVTTDSKTYQSRDKVRPSLGRHAVMAALMRLHHPSSRAAGWLTVSCSTKSHPGEQHTPKKRTQAGETARWKKHVYKDLSWDPPEPVEKAKQA